MKTFVAIFVVVFTSHCCAQDASADKNCDCAPYQKIAEKEYKKRFNKVESQKQNIHTRHLRFHISRGKIRKHGPKSRKSGLLKIDRCPVW